jgi:TonB-dependent starch-binding outer membrane protein SusC
MKQFLHSKISLLLLLLFIGAALPPARAQQVTVQGQVSDLGSEGLPGATVLEKGTANATTTDINGRYSLSLSGSKPVLVVSFTGYQTRELALNSQTTLDIQLTPGAAVAVGYGTRPQAALTGAVATLPGEVLSHSPALNVTHHLAGRIPGLMATGSGGGEPGNDGASLMVRGVNSFGNTDPLIVVDGVPGRSLQRLDPNTIASISVLKDASAAIYGMQAGNGVLLVTTKRGHAGKPAFAASFNQGLARPTRLAHMAEAAIYATLLNEVDVYQLPVAEWAAATQAYRTSGVYTRPNGMQRAAPYSPAAIRQYAAGSDPWGHPNTDWLQAAMKPWAGQHQGNFSVSGGSKRLQYYAALSSRGQQGFFRHNDTRYQQQDFRSNLDGQLTRHIRLALDVMGRMEERDDLRSTDRLFQMAMHSKPTQTAYWPNGSPGPAIEYDTNPVVATSGAMSDTRERRYVANTNLLLEVAIPWVKGLSVTGNAAVDKGIYHQEIKGTPWSVYSWNGTRDASGQPVLVEEKKETSNASLSGDEGDNDRFLVNGLLKYEKTFLAAHAVHLLAGVERLSGGLDHTSTSYYRFPSSPESFDTKPSSAYRSVNKMWRKAFGRLHYGFRQKYLAEFAWAYQATSTFAPGNRSGFFPAVSVGYVLSAEDFWQQHLAGVNYFKLRASYGQTGHDPFALGSTGSALGTDDAANLAISIGEGGIPNPNLTWEKALQRNIGFDAGLLQNRLSITADYFDNLRSDIIWRINASVPPNAGMIIPPMNIGKSGNRGFDFGINYQPTRAGDFIYQVGVNGGYAKNRVIFIDEAPGSPEYQRTTGRPFGGGLYYQAAGIYHGQQVREDYGAITLQLRPGDILFRDVNMDGKINPLDLVRSEKTDIPTWIGGLTLHLGYKGFDLSALVQGAAGAERSKPL